MLILGGLDGRGVVQCPLLHDYCFQSKDLDNCSLMLQH